MATEKTPARLRVARAEESAVEWKVKARARREEIERLKELLEYRNESKNKLFNLFIKSKKKEVDLEKNLGILSRKLEEANQKIVSQKEELKKKMK